MNAKKILVPTDFSRGDTVALDYATYLAKQCNGRLIVVHVEEASLVYGEGEMYYGIPEPNADELMKMLRDVKPTDPSVSVEHRLIVGSPAQAVVRLAKDENVDMIVLSSHGRTGMAHVLMGSVAEAIMRKAKCPVLICKQGVAEPAVAKT